ncbi:multidrug efflux pump subunit AcrA (membrane-fusion protein) [Kribbella steppae]|uniref:Multidrug efflux pump subunit AcrA (Membrane-fusion protein) n=1 Tax=Kribbella steppae TaxID=2512223 RepID=A0A4V2S032_9ACTN|nr:peptidoglycan-binding protein [Kribbella steppae]TCO30106.1 multidrug efflux pump subunit AcrA (membrane-fusion protein) [Kribbella steppae]
MRRALTAVVVLAAGGAASAFLVNRGDTSQAADQTAAAVPVNTAKVAQQTLKDTETADGELGFGTTSAAVNRTAGTITGVPDSGQEFRRGHTVYSVDNKPTTLMYGALPAYRKLADGSEGTDVLQLEQNLSAMGYTGFTVDDEYTDATAEAVEEWQEDLGLDETGVVELGSVLFAPGHIRVDSVEAQEGTPIGPNQNILTYTGTTKAVTVQLDAADQRLAKPNAKVDVTLPDSATVPGRVENVSTVIIPAESPDKDPETKVEVIVAIDNQKAVAAWSLASVDVTFTASERKNVLTVPVSALVALREGGFGVEVSDGTASHYVPVKTGLFAGGQVEISGTGIKAGTVVGIPK